MRGQRNKSVPLTQTSFKVEMSVHASEIYERTVGNHRTSGALFVPRKLIGKRVLIIVQKDETPSIALTVEGKGEGRCAGDE